MGLESVIDEFDHGLAEAQNDADLKNIANYLMDSPKAKVKFFEYLIGSYRDAHKSEYKETPRKNARFSLLSIFSVAGSAAATCCAFAIQSPLFLPYLMTTEMMTLGTLRNYRKFGKTLDEEAADKIMKETIDNGYFKDAMKSFYGSIS